MLLGGRHCREWGPRNRAGRVLAGNPQGIPALPVVVPARNPFPISLSPPTPSLAVAAEMLEVGVLCEVWHLFLGVMAVANRGQMEMAPTPASGASLFVGCDGNLSTNPTPSD